MIKQLGINKYKKTPKRRTVAQLIECMDVLAAEVVASKVELGVERSEIVEDMRHGRDYAMTRFGELMDVWIGRFEKTGLAPDEE